MCKSTIYYAFRNTACAVSKMAYYLKFVIFIMIGHYLKVKYSA